MIDHYTFDICIGFNVLVFQTHENLSVEELTRLLGVQKGNSGEAFQLASSQAESDSYPRVPSNLFYVPDESHIRIVGAIDRDYAQNREFVIVHSEHQLLEKAKVFATVLHELSPENFDEMFQRFVETQG